MTFNIVAICMLLQLLQSYCPQIEVIQAFIPILAAHLYTLPFFFSGLLLHMFSHGGWEHLFGNLTVGIPCMMYLENKLSGKRMLKAFIMAGIGSAGVQALMPIGTTALIGSSGAIFGLFGMSCMMLGESLLGSVLGLSMLTLALIPQLGALSQDGFGGGVAHAAHIGGCITGIIMALYVFKRPKAALEPVKAPSPCLSPQRRREEANKRSK